MPEENKSKMKISIDGRSDIVYAESGHNLGEILRQISDLLGRNDRAITSASADGQPVSHSENAHLLEKSVNDFSLLEVETVNVRQQAAAALAEVRNHLPTLCKALIDVTKNIQSGDVLKGYKSLAACADLLNLIVRIIDEVRALLGIDLTQVKVDGNTVSEQLEQVRDVLKNAKTALDSNDIVTVADLMEYELAPRINRWDAILDKLLEAVGN